MSATPAPGVNDVTILDRLFRPRRNGLSLAAARALLKIDFEEADRERMRELSHKAQEGTLTAEQREEIDGYERVGHLLDLLHCKARQALKRARSGNGQHG